MGVEAGDNQCLRTLANTLTTSDGSRARLTFRKLAPAADIRFAEIMQLVREAGSGLDKPQASRADVSFALFTGGAVIGLLHLIGIIGFGRGFEMVAVARNLADHGAFADPFDAGATGPTAANPPVYPLLLACMFKILGNPNLVTWAATICNIMVNAVTAALLPRVAVLLFDDALPGVIASLSCLAAMQLMPAWDTGYTVAGLVLFCVFSASTMRVEGNTAGYGALAGLGAGVLALLNPASLIVALLWIAWLVPPRRSLAVARYGGAFLATLCLIVSVWVLRNDVQLGAPVLRTNFGMSVYASNNDCASASLVEDEREDCYQRHHPNTSRDEAQLVRTMGEVAYDRKRTADAWNWMASHPDRFRRLTLRRFREFWLPLPGDHLYTTAVVWLITGFSIPGLVLMARRRAPAIFFLLPVLLVYPLMYYVVVADMRYRYPVLWISALAAGYFVSYFKTLCQARIRWRKPLLM